MKRSTVLLLAVGALACRNQDKPREKVPALPTESVTVWTNDFELFAEYKRLIIGQDSRFAIHVTTLVGWKPLSQGTVALTLAMDNGTTSRTAADAHAIPGIFGATARPAKAGSCRLTVSVTSAGASVEIPLGACSVLADAAAVRPAQDTAGRITFLKEQQWRTDFASVPVAERELQPSVRTTGEIRPVSGKDARLAATAAGRVTFASPPPVLGMTVRKGQTLATLAPRLTTGWDPATLEAEVAAARAESTAADAQRSRAERLFADQSVPKKSVEQAQADAAVARARLQAAEGRRAQFAAMASGSGGRGVLQIRSPLDGTLTSVDAASGESVEDGKVLFTVMDLRHVWLAADVTEPDIPKVEQARTGWFTLEGYEAPFVIDAKTARLVTLGKVIDPQTRTAPLIFEIDNSAGRLRVGQFAKINVATGVPVRLLAVPDSAIIDEAGKPIVYVQVEGEAFERRPVKLGAPSLGWTGIADGVRPGERVVTRGAYEVKLSSASGSIPAHGHAH